MSVAPLVLVAAVARNGIIGGGDKLLWRLSTDLKRFKALTLGRPVIMGRKTFDSIGKPLPGRTTVVVTRNPDFAVEGTIRAASLDEAIAKAQALAPDEIIIAGGGEIYAQAIGRADRMHITEVNLSPEGDTVFPRIDPAYWREVSRVTHGAGDKDEADFAFVDYVRR